MKKISPLGYILGSIILYVLSAGVSYAVFSFLGGSVSTRTTVSQPVDSGQQAHFVIDPSIPRTEECPINGKLHTKNEREIWEKRRPLAVMIENNSEARPQSGILFADIVYEAVAEGGITRFMGIFYCGSSAFDLGLAPVRSARTYFLDWVLEYDALYNHVGGANCSRDPETEQCTTDERAQAIEQIDKYGIKDMDQFGIPFPICFRNYDRLDHPVATEHTMVCHTDKLHELAAERGWTNVDEDGIAWDENFISWKFKDDPEASKRGSVTTVSFNHWDTHAAEYGVRWDYDPQTNSYLRFTGGVAHKDLLNDQQLTAKNVVIQFVEETVGIDAHAHILYGTIGSGKALIVSDGNVIEGTWRKPTRTARTKFFARSGNEVEFTRGQIWIEVVSEDTVVNY